MNTTATRIMLALTCGLLFAGPAMSANEMRFSDIEARIAAVEQKTSAIPGLKSAAFLSDGDAINAAAPNEAVRVNGEEELLPRFLPMARPMAACCCGSTVAAATLLRGLMLQGLMLRRTCCDDGSNCCAPATRAATMRTSS